MKAFEDATGEALDEEKKEIASEELIITGDLGEEIGQDKATGIVNDIKTEIIKNNTSDTTQIANTINNVTNNYNIVLNSDQQKQLEELMVKISKQDYDYNQMKNTLSGIKETIYDKLDELGESVDRSFFDTIKNWFSSVGDWFNNVLNLNKDKDLGILGSTNDSALGDNTIVDATDKEAINLPSSEEVEGFFTRVWNWFKGLFNKTEEIKEDIDSQEIQPTDNSIDDTLNSLEQNSTVEENVQSDTSSNVEELDNNSLEEVQTLEEETETDTDNIIENNTNELTPENTTN